MLAALAVETPGPFVVSLAGRFPATMLLQIAASLVATGLVSAAARSSESPLQIGCSRLVENTCRECSHKFLKLCCMAILAEEQHEQKAD